tara:strand:+ start:235 stop:1503 length:1269 start_codon:yes stop_codon:yes gene_type:complete
MDKPNISVIGLGYVGLPVSIAFDEAGFNVVGFDINKERIKQLKNNFDKTNEVKKNRLVECEINFTSVESKLTKSNFHIVTVPTPINEFKKPDFRHIISASELLAKSLKKNDIVVYESTVFPGATEEIAIPILENISGMKLNRDFSVGYSPERINPADPNHRFENIKKVVSASNLDALKIIERVYGIVVKAGIYVASSIKVAEAAKVIENTQRDLNIALMNEFVKIFDAMGVSTNDVLEAASTKWNFLNFHPGLVGGHCIGVDPYYLIYKSQQLGVIPDLLISARKINDSMSNYFAMKIFNALNEKQIEINNSKILILGITFKENCPDTRNSKVIDLVKELKSFRSSVDIYDPIVDVKEVYNEYGIDILNIPPENYYNIVVITVGHQFFTNLGEKKIRKWCKPGGIIMDFKNTISKDEVDFTL